MAVVVRYFSTAGAGTQDGTSWSNRAPLIVGGNWNSIITSFSFAGSDSLATMIGPGSYNATAATGWPSGNAANPHMAIAVDGSGNVWRPPSSWTSAMPKWDDSTMPTFEIGTSGGFGVSGGWFFGLRIFTNANRNGSLLTPSYANWCVIEHNGSAAAAGGLSFPSRAENCFIKMAGTQYANGIGSPQGPLRNIRIEGNPSATLGARNGLITSSQIIDSIVSINHVNSGLLPPNTTNNSGLITKCVVHNCGSGIVVFNRGGISPSVIANSIVVACGTAVDGLTSPSPVITHNNRFRNNTTDFSAITQDNTPWDLTNDFSAGSDADEFVNVATGDFRIKFGSALWGRGLGAGDEPPPSGSGIPIGRLISGGV